MTVQKLSKEQQEVWDRLNYVPQPGNDYYRFNTHKLNNPQVGDLYVDKMANQMRMYDGKQWVMIK